MQPGRCRYCWSAPKTPRSVLETPLHIRKSKGPVNGELSKKLREAGKALKVTRRRGQPACGAAVDGRNTPTSEVPGVRVKLARRRVHQKSEQPVNAAAEVLAMAAQRWSSGGGEAVSAIHVRKELGGFVPSMPDEAFRRLEHRSPRSRSSVAETTMLFRRFVPCWRQVAARSPTTAS